MLARINLFKIVRDHFGTLRSLNQTSNRIYWKDFILFIIFPFSVAMILTLKGIEIEKYIGNLIAAISIFGGFLFNLLAIIYSQLDKIKIDAKNERSSSNSKIKLKFVNEIHINISFNIVLSLLIVLFLILSTVEIPDFCFKNILDKIILCIDYYLVILFLLTIFMVLNRIYILLKKESDSI